MRELLVTLQQFDMSLLHRQAGWYKQLLTLSLFSMKVKQGENKRMQLTITS